MHRIITTARLAASALAGHAFANELTPTESFVSTADRAQVRAEYIASRDEVAALTSEDSGAFALAQQANGQVTRVAGSSAAY